MPATRVLYLPYFADERFWRALPGGEAPSARPMICAVGLEFRDYGTLLAAVRDLPVDLRIGAASSWSHHSAFEGSPNLPPNVHVHSYAYLSLRQLYAAARFVVEALFGLDAFTARFAAAIRGEQAPLVAPGEALPASSDAEMRAR